MKPSLVRPSKITQSHLSRIAIVYVRQSSLRQVEHHQESARLQYDLANTVHRWGWPMGQIEIIDEDQGKTAGSTHGRSGFLRMSDAIPKGDVGLIMGLDVSRLARNAYDWHGLLMSCQIFNTLVADQDGVYDLSRNNDRLLLGLKGSMSESELHTLRQRLVAGQRTKAEHGELLFALPTGYMRDEEDDIVQDVDEAARAVIALCFQLFAQLGTVHGVLRHLAKHGIDLPHRRQHKPGKGRLEWRPATRSTLKNVLSHPIYAGVYTYGRTRTDPRLKALGGSGRVSVPRDEWPVFIEDHHPAYITMATYEQNQKRLKANQMKHKGTVRKGAAMLAGLVRCGRCGERMYVQYSERSALYACRQQVHEYGGSLCQSMSQKPLDELVSGLVLEAIQPAALELSFELLDGLDVERKQLMALWQKKLERAAYESDRAFRQYNAIEPENRLVARTLEKRWEQALQAEAQLQREHREAIDQLSESLTPDEREEIRALATDLPALWHAETTTSQERQSIVKIMIENIIVRIEKEEVDAQIHWSGGDQTHCSMLRPVGRWDMLRGYEALAKATQELYGKGLSRTSIAQELNRQGWHSPRHKPFNASIVRSLLQHLGLATTATSAEKTDLPENTWTIAQLASRLGVNRKTVFTWLRKGKLTGKKQRVKGHEIWTITTTDDEIEQLERDRKPSKK